MNDDSYIFVMQRRKFLRPIIIRSAWFCLLLLCVGCLLVYAAVVSFPRAGASEPLVGAAAFQESCGIIEKTKASEWINQTTNVLGIGTNLALRTAPFRVQLRPNHSQDIPIVAFKSPRSGKVWVGPSLPFYVETETNIIGGWVSLFGDVGWKNNAVSENNRNLETAVQEFEKQTNRTKLIGPAEGPQTDLREALPPGFTARRGPTDSELIQPSIKSVEKEGSLVRLELQNPITQQFVTIWIDLTTRKPVRVMEKGKQIFPR